jgi:single-stranded DNA-specific DHH superfamily exonuclease
MTYVCYNANCINSAVSLSIFKIKFGAENIVSIPTCPKRGCLENFDVSGKDVYFVDVVAPNFDFFVDKAARVVVLDHHESNKCLKDKKFPPHVKIIISDKACGARLAYYFLMRGDRSLNILSGLIDVHNRWIEEKFDRWYEYIHGVHSFIRGSDNNFTANFYKLYTQMKLGCVTFQTLKKRGSKEIKNLTNRCEELLEDSEEIVRNGKKGIYLEVTQTSDWDIRSDIGSYFLAKKPISYVLISKFVEKENIFICTFRSNKDFNLLKELNDIPHLVGDKTSATSSLSYDEIGNHFEFI